MQLREILQPADSPIRSILLQAIYSIDCIHRFPATQPFPLVVSTLRNEQGVYHYRSRPARPEKIEISRRADFPQLTLIHEVGHFLDHLALNPIKREFGTDHDPLFEPLLTLWAKSPELLAANNLLRRFGKWEAKSQRTALRYYLTPRELWARSYTQWIVTRSADSHLAEQLRLVDENGWTFAGRRCSFYWGSATFKPIMQAVDRLMESAGLL